MLKAALVFSSLVCLTAGAARAQTEPPAPSAAPVEAPDAPNPDPWEHTNRAIYRFSRALDRVALRPGAIFYKRVTPRPARDGIHNIVQNLGGPVTFINDVLQVRPVRAGRSLGRFVVNTTVGIGGVFDVATGAGLPYHASNFGQTLGRYGAPQGPYIFLPVFGPSSVRDLTGKVADAFLDPFNVVRYDGRTELGVFRVVGGGLDARSRGDKALKELDRTATDPYATIRSFYLQSSARPEGAPVNVETLPDFGAPGAAPAGQPASAAQPAPPPHA